MSEQGTPKVFNLANDMGMPSLELLKVIREHLKIEIKSHMSDVSPDLVEKVKDYFKRVEEEKAAAAKTKKKSGVVRKKAPASEPVTETKAAAPKTATKAPAKTATKTQAASAPQNPVTTPATEAAAASGSPVVRRIKKGEGTPGSVLRSARAAQAAQDAAMEGANNAEFQAFDETSGAQVPEDTQTGATPAAGAPAAGATASGFRSATILSRPDKPMVFKSGPDRGPRPTIRPAGTGIAARSSSVPILPEDLPAQARDAGRTQRGAVVSEEEAAAEAKKRLTTHLKKTETFDPGEYFKKTRGTEVAVKRKRSALGRPARKTLITKTKDSKRVVDVDGTISIGELARQMSVKADTLMNKAVAFGMAIESEQSAIDVDSATLLAHEFSFEVKDVGFKEEDAITKIRKIETTESNANAQARPPVVTVMGHVDHGKTSLLDRIRNASVAAGEAGGITQHIGAYMVTTNGKNITFIDTPGHEAFTKMRARGAKTTDLVVLVVAADDGVMPQTIEAINHAKAAGAPIIVAINKIDLKEAQPDRVKNQLTEHGVVSEEWGGDAIMIPVSAVSGQGINELLESILLQAEVMELKADPTIPAKGTVLESRLDKNAGPLVSVLIQEGTLHTGDLIVSGNTMGKVRRLNNDRGQTVKEAGPSVPVEILGLSGVPDSGELVLAVADERMAKDLIQNRIDRERAKAAQPQPEMTLEELYAKMKAGKAKELAIVVKADVKGSLEACSDALMKLQTDQVKLKIIHSDCGGITENDVQLAAASSAVIFGFNVRPDGKALKLAEQKKIQVKVYKIIYEMVEEVKAGMAGLLGTRKIEKVLGRAEVRQTFSVPKIGVIAGTSVTDGKIARSSSVRLLRDSRIIFEGRISSLKRFKDDVREVEKGYECGIGIENFNDIKQGDVIEAFMVEEVPIELEAPAHP